MRLLAAPAYFEAHEALPWVALGWALYGLFLVFVTIAGRAKVTTRNFPAAAAGLVVNVVALVLLVGPLGIAGAGIALCAAYLVMLVVLHLLTRRLFHVPFEWRRLARDRRDHRRHIDRRGTGVADRRARGIRRSYRGPGRDPARAAPGTHLHGGTTRQVLGIRAFTMNMPPSFALPS